MKKDMYLKLLLTLILFNTTVLLKSQVPTCGSNVPYFQINLTGNPNGVWLSPSHQRVGNCCGTTNPDNCTSFEVTLDPSTVMIEFDIVSGAIPSGAMFYQINCGPQVPVGSPICLSGVGPHHITFCKPGNNENVYMIKAISAPILPSPIHSRVGCSTPISIAGVDTSSITWTSIYPGTTGQYNSYLSCLSGCANPIFTPDSNAPAYIDYVVTGTPIATSCGYFSFADTLRIYIHEGLEGTVTPNPASFCSDNGGVTLTASGTFGYGQYSYIWRDTSTAIIGNGPTYFATATGMYFVEILDELYTPGTCPATFISVPVTETGLPVVNAGADQSICTADPIVYLTGTVQNAPGIIWTGGNGTFFPDNTTLLASYVPSAAELAAGSVTLTLTTTGVSGGCNNTSDVVMITFPPPLTVTMANVNADCNNSTSTLTPNVSGGVAPYTFIWNTGSNAMSITATQGNYCVDVTDNMGCFSTVCANIIAPAPLNISMSATAVTTNNGNNGTATATVSGGVSPYSYSWTPGNMTTSTVTGLTYGVYSVTVTDSRGCMISSSIVVNEPRCSTFDGSIIKTDVACHNGNTGSASVTITGGVSPYTYQWDDASMQTTATANNLPAGSYIVVVTDSTGCLFSAGVSIFESPQLTNVMNQTNITTVGGTDGTATANTFGGTPGYTYSWSNGATTQTINNLSSGTYIVTITDANGCQLTDSVIMNDAQCNSFVVSSNVTSISCNGASDGSIMITALHGVMPYTYLWNTGSTDSLINNLPAGSYQVTVTDAQNCKILKNITIVQPAPLSIALIPKNVSCNGVYDGSIEMVVSGGTFPFYYNWSNGISVEDLIDLGPGTYTVTLNDDRGCTTTGSATITSPAPMVVSSSSTSPICYGGTGSINITVSGGTTPYSYSWSNGATSEDLNGAPADQYSLTVTDNNGCTTNPPLQLAITEPAALEIASDDVDCPVPGSGVAYVTVTPTGGSGGPYQVSFDNGITYQNFGDYDVMLPVGTTYSVTVKDSNGCVSPTPEEIDIRPAVTFTYTFNTCFASQNDSATITISPSGGKSPYSVSLDGGLTYQTQGDYSFTVPINATYNIVIKDNKNCKSETIIVGVPAQISLTTVLSSYNGNNITCNGATDGEINLSVNGGTAPYSYAWTNGITTQDLNNLAAGEYSVLVTDANGCTATLTDTLTEPLKLNANALSTGNFQAFDISCNGFNDGSIDLTVSGGTAGYTYLWSNTETSEDLIKLNAGTYSVTVLDQNGCKTTASVTLSEPPLLSATALSLNDYNGFQIRCYGMNDAGIDLTVSGGVSGYNYSWSNGITTEDLSSLGIGNYSVTVTDQNNCTATAAVVISEPPALTSTIVPSDFNGSNISCAGLSDGSVNITASGGVPTYLYSWTNGATTEDQSNLGAGTYSVSITDANGCTEIHTITLSEPPALSASALATTNFTGYQVSCFGSSDGNIDLTTTGGTGPYFYSWSTNANTQDLTGIPAGQYSVTVTDQNNCSATTSILLSEPPAILSTLDLGINYNGYGVSCFGKSDGALDLQVNGGTGTYTYTWNNGSTTEDLNGIPAGTYSVVVTDENNCSSISVLSLTEPAELLSNINTISLYNIYNVSCKGSTDGAIDAMVTGGVSAYTYTWSNGSTTEDLNSLGAGSYSLTVIDANNCVANLDVTLVEPADVITSGNTSDYNGYAVSCYGGSDGEIDLNVSGGTGVYSYAWSTGNSDEDAISLTAGTFSVIVTDANTCSDTLVFNLNQPDSVHISADIVNVPCNGFTNGAIDLTVNGGVSNYTYSWSTHVNSEDLTDLTSGTYTVTIKDMNNCVKEKVYTIKEASPLIVDINVTNANCAGETGSASINVTGGTPGYQYNWSNGGNSSIEQGLEPGTYEIFITDQNKCSVLKNIEITEPQVLTLNVSAQVYANGFNISNFGAADGVIKTAVAGGTAPYNFTWSNGSTNNDLTNVGAGLYILQVTDSNGCALLDSAALNEPFALSMPTGYSPNGDGNNDYFVVRGIENYPDNELFIYNRWGNLVFDQEDYQNTWNGKANSGSDLPEGTYFVILKLTNGPTLTGYVDLRR